MFCILVISVLLFCLPGWQLLSEKQMKTPVMKKHWLLWFNERTVTNSHQSFIDSNTRTWKLEQQISSSPLMCTVQCEYMTREYNKSKFEIEAGIRSSWFHGGVIISSPGSSCIAAQHDVLANSNTSTCRLLSKRHNWGHLQGHLATLPANKNYFLLLFVHFNKLLDGSCAKQTGFRRPSVHFHVSGHEEVDPARVHWVASGMIRHMKRSTYLKISIRNSLASNNTNRSR